MRVLWLCNMMLPIVGKHLNKPFSNLGGWLDGISTKLLEDDQSEIELAVVFPVSIQERGLKGSTEAKDGKKALTYYGFPRYAKNESIYDARTEKDFKIIIEEFKPDIVHIFGTEFAHSLAMTRVFPARERMIISMQGVMRVCAKKYEAGLPYRIVRRYTIRDCVKRDNVKDAKTKFIIRAGFEIESLNNVRHVVGRTDFDRIETKKINKNRIYHKINETLRSPFYENEWSEEHVEKHSLFFGQGNYPLKGLHYMLEALSEIKKEFPDVKLYVAGDRIVPDASIKSRLKTSSYGKYLASLIRKNKLKEQVVFTGSLNAEEMCKRYLGCQAFVSTSVIENSPNAVGEAMLLGMPIISSKVGGVPSMLEDGKEGLLVKISDQNELVQAVHRIFTDREMAMSFGVNARARALETHHAEKNFRDLEKLYQELGKEENEA